jgi:hypothetical protein
MLDQRGWVGELVNDGDGNDFFVNFQRKDNTMSKVLITLETDIKHRMSSLYDDIQPFHRQISNVLFAKLSGEELNFALHEMVTATVKRCEQEKQACHLIVLAHAFAGALTFMRSQMPYDPDHEDGAKGNASTEHHTGTRGVPPYFWLK